MKNTLVLRANNFKSCLLKNNGKGKFEMLPLPVVAQLAPVYGIVTDDFNKDGNLDIALCGNDFGTEVTNGRYDGMNGLVLTGDGKGNFTAQTILHSGLFVPGDAKALVKLKSAGNNYLLASSQNRGPLKLFSHNSRDQKVLPLSSTDRNVLITLANGQTRKEEIYNGTSFLSQSAPFIVTNSMMKKIEIVNNKGEKRVVQ